MLRSGPADLNVVLCLPGGKFVGNSLYNGISEEPYYFLKGRPEGRLDLIVPLVVSSIKEKRTICP